MPFGRASSFATLLLLTSDISGATSGLTKVCSVSGSLWRLAFGCCVVGSELLRRWRRRERVAVAGPPLSTAFEEAMMWSGRSLVRWLGVVMYYSR